MKNTPCESTIQKFSEWLEKQSTPKSKQDKSEYLKRSTNSDYQPLAKFLTKYKPGVATLPEAPLPLLYDASLNLDLEPKYISILNKSLQFRLSLEEEISPSKENCGEGLSIYGLISAIHRARIIADKNAYNLITASLLLQPDMLISDNADDHLRPEKSDKYKLYRQIMLYNLVNRYDEVIKRLSEALSSLSPVSSSSISFMQESMIKVGRELIRLFETQEGFHDSAAQHLLLRLAGASADTVGSFNPKEITAYYSNIVARLSIIALNNQGYAFAGDRLPHCTKEEDILLYTLLSPFSESLTVKLVDNAQLLDNPYFKRLIYQGLLYPSIVPGSKYARLVTAGGYESNLPKNTEGINLLKKVYENPAMGDVMYRLLSEIYKMQIKELEDLKMHKGRHFDKGLFTFPKELVTLLAAAGEEDCKDKKNLRFDTCLTTVLAISHWVNLRLITLSAKERFESASRLSKLLSCRPVTVCRAIASLPDFHEKLKDTSDEKLKFNRNKENLLLAGIKLSASEEALDIVSVEMGAENFEIAEFYIITALKFAKDSENIASSLNDLITASSALLLSAEGYAKLSLIKCKNNNADMLTKDVIIPASKCLFEAEALLEKYDNPESSDFLIARKNYYDAVEFCSSTFYSDSSPVYKVLTEDSDIKIPLTLSYKTLSDCANRLHFDEIPEKVKSTPSIKIPHKEELHGFFRPFYITDFDSELTARKNLTSDKIQPLLMKTVLSGHTIRLTANQIADNPEILKLCDSHGFLSLVQKGFVSLSLYGNVKSLTDYVLRSLQNPKFIFSSLPTLNYYGEKFECKKAQAIMKTRLLAGDFISGKIGIDLLPYSLRPVLSEFKERILCFDENFPTASKYHNYQRKSADLPSLPEQFSSFFSARKNLAEFSTPYKIHETILKYLPEDYDRSHYKNFIDKIKNQNYIGTSVSDRDKTFLRTFSDEYSTDTTNLLTDILTECHNTVLGSRVSPNIHYTYRDSDKLIPGDEYTASFSSEGETAYHDIITVEETGEAIDFDALIYHLILLEAKVRENKNSFPEDKLAYSLEDASISYSVSDKGELSLDKVSLLTTESQNVSVENTQCTDNSVLHIEKGKKAKI